MEPSGEETEADDARVCVCECEAWKMVKERLGRW